MEKRDCLEAYFDKLLVKADELGNLGVHIADDRTVLSKLIWTAVKVYGQRDACEPKTKEYAERKFHSCKLITYLLKCFTFPHPPTPAISIFALSCSFSFKVSFSNPLALTAIPSSKRKGRFIFLMHSSKFVFSL